MVLSKFCFLIFFVVDWNFALLEKPFNFVVENFAINSEIFHIVAYFLYNGNNIRLILWWKIPQ